MATGYLLKKGKSWYLGFPSEAPYGDAQQSAEVARSCDSAHTKDENGNDAMSVYYNGQATCTVTAVTADATVPSAGEEFTYNGITFVITSASVAYNNGETGATVTVTGESRDAWSD